MVGRSANDRREKSPTEGDDEDRRRYWQLQSGIMFCGFPMTLRCIEMIGEKMEESETITGEVDSEILG